MHTHTFYSIYVANWNFNVTHHSHRASLHCYVFGSRGAGKSTLVHALPGLRPSPADLCPPSLLTSSVSARCLSCTLLRARAPQPIYILGKRTLFEQYLAA